MSRNVLEMDRARIRRNNAQYLHVFFKPARIAPGMVEKWQWTLSGHIIRYAVGSNAYTCQYNTVSVTRTGQGI